MDNSVQLIPYTSAAAKPAIRLDDPSGLTTTINNSIYFRLTETRFQRYTPPKYYYPEPKKSDYKTAQLKRFFVQKINNYVDITEVDADDYNNVNKSNEVGIDGGIFRKIQLQWSISGPLSEVRKVNRKIIISADNEMPGIVSYLTDLDEFHKDRHLIKEDSQDNLHTSGGEYTLPDGTDYVGFYHKHPTHGPMEGPEHTNYAHQRLNEKCAKPTGYHTSGTPAYLNRFRPGGDLSDRNPTGYNTPGNPAWLNRFRSGGDKANDPKPTGWWSKGMPNYGGGS